MGDHAEKTPERLSKLGSSRTYAQGTKSGFRGGLWQAHHILCQAVVGDGRRTIEGDSDHVQFIEACLWITDWDLHGEDNLIGLPTKKQIYATFDTPAPMPTNLPCHDVDHSGGAGYNKECQKWVKQNVWNSLQAKKADHEVDAESLKQQLDDGSAYFRGALERRAGRPKGGASGKKGTVDCWARRFDSHPEHEPRWYEPFSMAKDPPPRKPGISMTDLKGVFGKIG